MPFNVLTDIAWKAAFWAEDPSWTPPSDGGAVTSWRDAGSAASDAVTSSVAPIYRASHGAFNNRPAIVFNASSTQSLKSPDWSAAITSGTTVTFVSIVQITGVGISQSVIADANIAGSTFVMGANASNLWSLFRGGGGNLSSVVKVNDAVMLVGSMQPSVDGTLTVNNVKQISGAGPVAQSMTGIWLGNRNGGGYLSGAIAFAAVYEGSLSGTDLQNLRQWANQVYNIGTTDFAVDPGFSKLKPYVVPGAFIKSDDFLSPPVSVTGPKIIQPYGAHHPPTRKFPNDQTTGTMLFDVPGTSMSQVSDYDLFALEGDPCPTVNPTLSFEYPSDITVAAGDLLAVHACVGGGNALAQTLSFTATNGVVLNIPLDSVFGAGVRFELGSTAHGENLNGRFGGMTVGFWKNTTGASVTTRVTLNVTGSINRSVSGTPNRQMSHAGFIWPVVTRGTVAPVYLDGAATVASYQNATSLGLGWQGGSSNSRLLKAGTWAWGMIASKDVNSMSSLTNGGGSQVVWAFDPVRAGNTTTQYAYALYRGSLPNTQDGVTNRLPAIGSQQSHYLTYELQPETGFYDNDIRNLRKQVTPGEFVKKAVDGSMMAPVSITGPKIIQRKGYHPLNHRSLAPVVSTASVTEGLSLSPFTPMDTTCFEGRQTYGVGGGRVMPVNPFLIGPGEVALLMMQIECLASSNITSYVNSTVSSVVEGPNSTARLQPSPLSWALVRNQAGTRAWTGHSTGTGQFGGFIAIYFAYNPPGNGWVVSQPIVTVTTDAWDGVTPVPFLGGEFMPVVFRNAYPYLAGGNFGLSAQSSGPVTATPVGGSSWMWAVSGSKDRGTGVNSSATNCDYHYAGRSSSTPVFLRGFDVLRSTKLNGPAGSLNPAISYTTFNNNGGGAVWIEMRQAESAKPKRLVYPGFGAPGGAPGGRLEAFIPGEEVQNALNIYSKQGGVQVQAIGLKVKSGGSWVDATAVWYRDAGVWVIV